MSVQGVPNFLWSLHPLYSVDLEVWSKNVNSYTWITYARIYSITTRTSIFVSEYEIICGSRTRFRVMQWENVFTRCQSLSKSCAKVDAIRLIRARLASLLHTSRSTEYTINSGNASGYSFQTSVKICNNLYHSKLHEPITLNKFRKFVSRL